MLTGGLEGKQKHWCGSWEYEMESRMSGEGDVAFLQAFSRSKAEQHVSAAFHVKSEVSVQQQDECSG